MAQTMFQVQTYSISLYPGYQSKTEYHDLTIVAKIECVGQTKVRHMFTIYFPAPGKTPPENWSSSTAQYGAIYPPADHFPWYVDLLRNEAPVHAVIDSRNPQTNGLHSGQEPAGEGET